jgi:hypothetical protein
LSFHGPFVGDVHPNLAGSRVRACCARARTIGVKNQLSYSYLYINDIRPEQNAGRGGERQRPRSSFLEARGSTPSHARRMRMNVFFGKSANRQTGYDSIFSPQVFVRNKNFYFSIFEEGRRKGTDHDSVQRRRSKPRPRPTPGRNDRGALDSEGVGDTKGRWQRVGLLTR